LVPPSKFAVPDPFQVPTSDWKGLSAASTGAIALTQKNAAANMGSRFESRKKSVARSTSSPSLSEMFEAA
jgi:hypothetical protein